jgi:Reverse transcriptase (RNA-dependent DNA polymerase)
LQGSISLVPIAQNLREIDLDWSLTDKSLKRYPHFDSDISADDAEMLVKDPARVSTHSFYPFIFYEQRWNKWAPKGETGKIKKRPIRYASRRDAYIFSYYRSLLATEYEKRLAIDGLGGSVLAYRKIIGVEGNGQCNIDFAKQAFDCVKHLSNCVVLTLDISSFFESLAHEKIKSDWCSLLGQTKLSRDHFQVFKSITRYSFIERDALYTKLGFLGPKTNPITGAIKIGYLIPFDQMPKRQICKPETLRRILKSNPTLLTVNKSNCGVPQGAPISDLLANLYMFDFDKHMHNYAKQLGGTYLRYSDDIIIVLPGDATAGQSAKEEAIKVLEACAPGLAFKLEKTFMYEFTPKSSGGQNFTRLLGQANQGANGLEYLGFRFDGQSVFIRDSTLSNLWRKITKSANRHAIQLIKRYRDKDIDQLHLYLNEDDFVRKFGRVEDFFEGQDDVGKWTFWTYVKRCQKVFGSEAQGIAGQLRAHRRVIGEKLRLALEYYFGRI